MKKGKFSESQIISALKKGEAGVADLLNKTGVVAADSECVFGVLALENVVVRLIQASQSLKRKQGFSSILEQ